MSGNTERLYNINLRQMFDLFKSTHFLFQLSKSLPADNNFIHFDLRSLGLGSAFMRSQNNVPQYKTQLMQKHAG